MPRETFHQLAAQGHCIPIATDLILRRKADSASVELDGERLGEVLIESARTFESPLAIPLMDLKIEKEAILEALGVPTSQIDGFHFAEPPEAVREISATPRMKATCGSIARVAAEPDLLPIGMCIGPFSLMTKMVSDPITPVYMAGTGATAEDDEDIEVIESCLAMGTDFILRYIEDQIHAGARAMIVCEPAANLVYLSPNQLQQSFAIFDRYVMEGLQRITALLAQHEVDFILHDCGELTDPMIERFATLNPAMLSLGGSRKLWEDARLLAPSTVLYGNLPSKRFYAPELTAREVEDTARSLRQHMAAARHPFILGSECDILSVPGKEREILSKVEALKRAGS